MFSYQTSPLSPSINTGKDKIALNSPSSTRFSIKLSAPSAPQAKRKRHISNENIEELERINRNWLRTSGSTKKRMSANTELETILEEFSL